MRVPRYSRPDNIQIKVVSKNTIFVEFHEYSNSNLFGLKFKSGNLKLPESNRDNIRQIK